MGICVARFHFKNGTPKVAKIQKKFNELTGLEVNLNVQLNLVHLPCSNKEIVDALHDDQKLESFIKTQPHLEKQEKCNSIGGLNFESYGFEPIAIYDITQHNFTFEYSIWGSYFSESLLKTIYELAGRNTIDHNNTKIEDKQLEPYNSTEKRWTKLKRWEDYNLFTRPKKY